MEHLNILVCPMGRDGCSGYRQRNPYKTIEKLGIKGVDVIFMSKKMDGNDILRLIQGADVIVFRQGHNALFEKIKKENLTNAILVLDVDDDIYNITPFSENYALSGLEEVEYDGKKLWEDGKDNFDIERNKKRIESDLYMIREADIVTVTTEYLAKRMKEIGAKNVAVLDNAIDFEHWKKWDFKKNNEIRIGWTGGSTHYIDWHSIKDPLKRVFDKYKDTDTKLKLVLQGCKWDGTIKDIPYEFHSWIDFEGHPYKTASLNLDIAIIPLVDTEFNRHKSCIKWYEFSSLGIPSVVSDVLPYAEYIDDDNSLPYKDEKEFEEQLIKLIEDEKLRKKIGKNALEWVKKNKDLKNIAKDYIKVLKQNVKHKSSSIIS